MSARYAAWPTCTHRAASCFGSPQTRPRGRFQHLNCGHHERLTLSRIDLARHYRGAGSVFGKLEQRYIVFDRFYQTVHPAT